MHRNILTTLVVSAAIGILPFGAQAQTAPQAAGAANQIPLKAATTAAPAAPAAAASAIPAFAKPDAKGPVPVAAVPATPAAAPDVQTAGKVVGPTPAADKTAAVADAKTAAAKPADEDPLAQFREAFGAAQTPTTQGTQQQGNGSTKAPLPTPGGLQQPAGTDPLAGYDMSLNLTPEELASEQKRKQKQEGFEQALDATMPMTTEQIGIMKDKFRETRQASETRIGGTPKAEVSVQNVSLDPGTQPPVITLSPGFVTTLNLIDLTGQPWPVKDVSWGGNFEILSPGEGGHIIRISPMAATEVGNMSVQMVGLKTPVTFALKTDLEHVQYRVDARIPEYGPNSKTPVIAPGVTTTAGDKTMMMVLDGVPPSGTQKLAVSGVDGRTSVYSVNDTFYLRTPHTLLSPGWSASASSADGMTVYQIPATPVVLLSDKGRTVRTAISASALKTASKGDE